MALIGACIALALAASGCIRTETMAGCGPFRIDGGESGYSTISTSMGAYPGGAVAFTLVPTDEAVAAYGREHPGADREDLALAWADAARTATVGGVPLVKAEYAEWIYDMQGPQADREQLRCFDADAVEGAVRLMVPVVFLDTSEEEVSTNAFSVEADGFDPVEGELSYRRYGSDTLVVRMVDRPAVSGNFHVLEEAVFTMDELTALGTVEGYETSANCGMAGIRSFYSEGVLLADVLEAAGIDFGPGMELQMRVGDYATTSDGNGGQEDGYYDGYGGNGTLSWEYLFGSPRYDYPAMWDDDTVYEELGGQSVYAILSVDKDAWKGDDERAVALRRILGASKVEVQPLLALRESEGVVAWGSPDPRTQDYGGSPYDPYSSLQGISFLFGMLASEDGSIADENTTFSNSGMVFGLDVIAAAG